MLTLEVFCSEIATMVPSGNEFGLVLNSPNYVNTLMQSFMTQVCLIVSLNHSIEIFTVGLITFSQYNPFVT